jgi:hypothetical protein
MSGVFRDGGISTGMEPRRTKEKKMSSSRLTEVLRNVRIMLTTTCTNPCKAAYLGPSRVPIEH